MFPHVNGQFPVGIVCSATFQVDFRSAEGVPTRPGLISGRQSMFRPVPEQYPASRVCSATFRVNFRSTECVPPCPRSIFRSAAVLPRTRSISGWQSVFRHVPGRFPVSRGCSTTFQGRFPVGRVCSATSWVDFRSVEGPIYSFICRFRKSPSSNSQPFPSVFLNILVI